MSHFYESILSNEINYLNEINNIDELLWREYNYFGYGDTGRTSLGGFFDLHFFRKLNLSHNYISLRSFLDDAVKNVYDHAKRYIYYCEAVLSLFLQFFELNVYFRRLSDSDFITSKTSEIKKIIKVNLDTLNLTTKTIENKLGKIITIVPKNQVLEKALNIVDNKNIRTYLIEYCSSKNNGNTESKTDILRLIENYIEGITKNKELRQLNSRLFDDVDFLYNNLDLRHNVKVSDKKFYERTYLDREKWLDITYNESLLVICSEQEFLDHKLIKDMRTKQ